MIRSWLKTISSMYRLRYIVGYNGFIYKLKLLPLIGRLLPDDLYSIGFFKFIYAVWKFITEFFMLFFLKVLGLSGIYAYSFIMRSLADNHPEEIGGMRPGQFQGTAFMWLFLAYAFAGVLMNTNLFSYTPEKEYAVFMLRMDAKKINTSYFVLNLAALFIGYAGVNLFFGIISGMPFLMWFFTPLLGVAIKLAGAGVKLGIINMKRRLGLKIASGKIELVGVFFKVFIGFTAVMTVMIMTVNAYCPPVYILPVIAAVITVLAVAGFFVIRDFDPYAHKQLLAGAKETYNVEKKSYKSPDRTKRLKKVNKVSAVDTRVSSDKTGFAFLARSTGAPVLSVGLDGIYKFGHRTHIVVGDAEKIERVKGIPSSRHLTEQSEHFRQKVWQLKQKALGASEPKALPVAAETPEEVLA